MSTMLLLIYFSTMAFLRIAFYCKAAEYNDYSRKNGNGRFIDTNFISSSTGSTIQADRFQDNDRFHQWLHKNISSALEADQFQDNDGFYQFLQKIQTSNRFSHGADQALFSDFNTNRLTVKSQRPTWFNPESIISNEKSNFSSRKESLMKGKMVVMLIKLSLFIFGGGLAAFSVACFKSKRTKSLPINPNRGIPYVQKV